MSFGDLPFELYDAILRHVPAECLQRTTWSVIQVLPLAPIPKQSLFRCIRLSRPRQAILLYQALRREKCGHWVDRIAFETFDSDPEILLNIVPLLTSLTSITIWIGAENFQPRHLEHLLEPTPNLRNVSLRFRPFNENRWSAENGVPFNFHRGVYFDSVLVALSQWPLDSLPSLSIIQDAWEPAIISPKTIILQPYVFYRLDQSLPTLLRSDAVSQLTALRLSIPSRPILRSILPLFNNANISTFAEPILPNLELLDLTTSGLLESEVDTLLVRFPSIRHLILDRSIHLSGDATECDWAALGRRCALAGVKRAKECEKSLKLWLQAYQEQGGGHGMPGVARRAEPSSPSSRRAKPGRKGLSTPRITLRETELPHPADLGSTQGSIVQDSVLGDTEYHHHQEPRWKPPTKIRILPSVPQLRTLCAALPGIEEGRVVSIRREFESGWAEGVASLWVIRARMEKSLKTGAYILRFGDGDEQVNYHGLPGLTEYTQDLLVESRDVDETVPPILCLAGLGDGSCAHSDHCGHMHAHERLEMGL